LKISPTLYSALSPLPKSSKVGMLQIFDQLEKVAQGFQMAGIKKTASRKLLPPEPFTDL